nr:VWA domain-containing protein [Ardenticatena sp.]
MKPTRMPITEHAPRGYLLGHVLRFVRLLRRMGVGVSLSQVLDLVEALKHVPITNRRDFYYTARALLITRREDMPVFDEAFALFWRMHPSETPSTSGTTRLKRLRLPAEEPPAGEENEGDEGDEVIRIERRFTYSPTERLRHKDFAEMTWEEIQEAKHAIAAMAWKLGMRRTRRYQLARKGTPSLRRLLRDNLTFGGEPVRLAYRQRREVPRPLVILCDISGSMERYSRMLLHFTHALTHGLKEVETEVFVFGTRLTRITHHLRHRDVDESLDAIGKTVEDWAGGTRIGDAIKTFNYEWARRVLGRGAVVLIISDGWDRGDVGTLAHEMARLQRAAHRLIWLNPLLGMETYEPIQRGMAAALPYVDDFLPVHNLASLEQLADVLASVGEMRPVRRQHVRRTAAPNREEQQETREFVQGGTECAMC